MYCLVMIVNSLVLCIFMKDQIQMLWRRLLLAYSIAVPVSNTTATINQTPGYHKMYLIGKTGKSSEDRTNIPRSESKLKAEEWMLLSKEPDALSLHGKDSQHKSSASVDFVLENSNRDDNANLPGICQLLDTWLAGDVFPRFRDTEDNNFKLGNYYNNPIVLSYLERVEVIQGSPLTAAAAMARIQAEHVKDNAIQAPQEVYPSHYAARTSTEVTDVQEMMFTVDHVGNNEGHDGGVSESSIDTITVDRSTNDMVKEERVKLAAARTADSGVLLIMDVRTAESIVSKWQKIKPQAFHNIDVHCLASLIKAWVRELPRCVFYSLSSEQLMESESEGGGMELMLVVELKTTLRSRFCKQGGFDT